MDGYKEIVAGDAEAAVVTTTTQWDTDPEFGGARFQEASGGSNVNQYGFIQGISTCGKKLRSAPGRVLGMYINV